MRKEKILFYSPGGVDNISGGEVSLLLILLNLKNYEPHVLLDRHTQFWRRLEAENVALHLLEKKRKVVPILGSILSLLAYNIAVFKLVRKTGATILHANNSEAMQNALLACLFTGTKLVFNIRGTPNIGFKWNVLLAFSHAVITNSNELSDHVVKKSGGWVKSSLKKKIFGVYSGLDLSKTTVIDPAFKVNQGVDESKVQIAMVGAVRPLKQQLELIRQVVPKVISKSPNCVFNIIGSADYGDEAYYHDCQSAIEQLELTRFVRLIPFNDQMANWYSSMDFTVLVSKKEGLARVMIEGMSYGTPMISFAVSSAREVLEGGHAGVVVPCNDFEGMAEAIISLANDKSQVKIFSKNSSAYVKKHFDIKVTAENYENIYRKL